MYGWETDQILQLSNEDQEDYLFLLNHVRYGDIYKLMEEVIKKQDPLGALPPPAIMHLTLEEARRLGWMTTDWELKNRTLHPQNALMEGDIYHLFYWGTLTLGSLFGGGGAMFSKGAADLALLRSTSKVEGDFVETVEGPKTRAESKRGFFS
ncbi:hypothetical protein AGDE_00614 [Angomonas deanei]|nr:hypothetical protein AGDE_07638 [Angomonas deanei]EPY43308.1 hypothetical protein AGDE_00614 [Angomonas deanei]|eukprot:EPY34999.1 hypothetical protein AGDE_07638 [Angomonas deanei]